MLKAGLCRTWIRWASGVALEANDRAFFQHLQLMREIANALPTCLGGADARLAIRIPRSGLFDVRDNAHTDHVGLFHPFMLAVIVHHRIFRASSAEIFRGQGVLPPTRGSRKSR